MQRLDPVPSGHQPDQTPGRAAGPGPYSPGKRPRDPALAAQRQTPPRWVTPVGPRPSASAAFAGWDGVSRRLTDPDRNPYIRIIMRVVASLFLAGVSLVLSAILAPPAWACWVWITICVWNGQEYVCETFCLI